ncbi:MAG: hypothetical protein ACYTBV_14625 [Planctomycetota bacterium]|jgi:hypothetical protein
MIGNAYAADVIWDNDAADNVWTNKLNWTDNNVPLAADTAYIDWSPDYNSIDIGCNVTLNLATAIATLKGPGARSPAEVGSSSLSLGTGAELNMSGNWYPADAQDANTTVVVDIKDNAQLTFNGFIPHSGYSDDPNQIPVGSGQAQKSRELTLNIGDDAAVISGSTGFRGGGYGHVTMNVTDNAYLHMGNQFRSSYNLGGATFNMSGNPTVTVSSNWRCGNNGNPLIKATIDGGTFAATGELSGNSDGANIDITMNGGSVYFKNKLGFKAGQDASYKTYNRLVINGGKWVHGKGFTLCKGAGAPGSYAELVVSGGLLETLGNVPPIAHAFFRAPLNTGYGKAVYIRVSGGYLNAGGVHEESADPNYLFIDCNDRDGGGVFVVGWDANAFNNISKANLTHTINDSNNAYRFKYIGPDNETGVAYIGITPKRQAWGPWPFDRRLYSAQTVTVMWQQADIIDAADSQKLYAGTDANALNAIAAGGAGQIATYGKDVNSHTLTNISPMLAQYWRVDSNDSGTWTKGDLWKFGEPGGKAEHPYPAHNSTVSDADLTLRWGQSPWPAYLINQNVYYGTNQAEVAGANTSDVNAFVGNYSADTNSYNVGALPLGAQRWWRIDSNMNTGDLVLGDVWKFTMANFYTIENFDWYQGTTNLRATWLDYYSDNTNGTVVTEQTEPNRYETRSHLMDFDWITSGYSHWDSKRTFASPIDMTTADLVALVLYSYGDPCNTSGTPLYSLTGPQKLYVTLSDDTNSVTLPYDGDANDIFLAQWSEWNLELADFAPEETMKARYPFA